MISCISDKPVKMKLKCLAPCLSLFKWVDHAQNKLRSWPFKSNNQIISYNNYKWLTYALVIILSHLPSWNLFLTFSLIRNVSQPIYIKRFPSNFLALVSAVVLAFFWLVGQTCLKASRCWPVTWSERNQRCREPLSGHTATSSRSFNLLQGRMY